MIELTADEASFLAMKALHKAGDVVDPRYRTLVWEEAQKAQARWVEIAAALCPESPCGVQSANWSPTKISREGGV